MVSPEFSEGRKKSTPRRSGYASDVPYGGADEFSQGSSVGPGAVDRPELMEELRQAYLTCTWASAAVDTIARTATAGGVEIAPRGGVRSETDLKSQEVPEEVTKVQALLNYVNPQNDIRQLMRGVVTDLMVYGDSFTEVVYSSLGEPVALYPLDPTTMFIEADEHGKVLKYVQKTETNRRAEFDLKEVIHVKFDGPGSTLYGISPTQKLIIPITSWLYTAALVRSTMKRGDPLRVWIDWPMGLPESEIKRYGQQYHVRNLGAKNIGNPVETKGGAILKELGLNQIQHWMVNLDKRRDEILSGYGVPPSKVGVIESGNIGGGTGTSQDRMFRVNTVGPSQELILEKWTFALLKQAYAIDDWVLQFGTVDWRDDEVIERIRDLRIRNGSNTLNRARADIGEPPVDGGDDPILVDRQNMVLWSDLKGLSTANLEVAQSQAALNAQSNLGTNKGAPGGAGDVTIAPNATGVNTPQPPNTNPGARPKKDGVVRAKRTPKAASNAAESIAEDDGDWIYHDNGSRTYRDR